MTSLAKKAELELEYDTMPGFRFRPTDEELVGFYLRRIVRRKSLAIALITQLDVYKFDPWELPKMAATGDREWFFYCQRGRKYRNSNRPNRVTGAGFWKATGTDKPIYAENGTHCVGLRKSLVFYEGRAPRGLKTDWMMHEFRLPSCSESSVIKREDQEDTWAIYKIFKKNAPTYTCNTGAAEQSGETTSHQNLAQKTYGSSCPRAAHGSTFQNGKGECVHAAQDPFQGNNNGPSLRADLNSLNESYGSCVQPAVQNSMLQEKK